MPDKTPISTSLRRLSPLAGAGCAVLTIVAYLVIGPNPDSDASTSKITAYYAAHHDHVRLAGVLLMYAAALFALFGVAVWTRIRETDSPTVPRRHGARRNRGRDRQRPRQRKRLVPAR